MELRGKTKLHHCYVTMKRQPYSFSSSPQVRQVDKQTDLSSADQSDSDGNSDRYEHCDVNGSVANQILQHLAAMNASLQHDAG